MRIVKIINNWMANCIIYIHTLSMYKIILSGLSLRYICVYIYIYIYIVVGILTKHDAWDCIVEFHPHAINWNPTHVKPKNHAW